MNANGCTAMLLTQLWTAQQHYSESWLFLVADVYLKCLSSDEKRSMIKILAMQNNGWR